MTPEQEASLDTFAVKRDGLLGELKILEDKKIVLEDANLSLTTSNSSILGEISDNKVRLGVLIGTYDEKKTLLDAEIALKQKESDSLQSEISILTVAISQLKELASSVTQEFASIKQLSDETKTVVLELVEGIKSSHSDSLALVSSLATEVQEFKNTVSGSVTEIVNENRRIVDGHRKNAEWAATLNERENMLRADEERRKLAAQEQK